MKQFAKHLPHLLLIFKIDQLRSLTSRKSSKLVVLPMRIEHTRFAEKSTYYVTRINLVEFSEVFSSKKGSKMSDDDVTTALVVLLTLFFILLLFITCFCHKCKLVHPLVKYKYYKRFFLIRRIGKPLCLRSSFKLYPFLRTHSIVQYYVLWSYTLSCRI